MKYGKKYAIDRNSKIMIYGAATTGAIVFSTFAKSKYDVLAFIDRRADEIESYYNLPVLNLEQTSEILKENKEVIIVIGIKNVFEHEKIAKELWHLGCDKIIFRPYDEVTGKGKDGDKELNLIYDNILSGQLPKEGCEIEEFEEHFFSDKAIIESGNQYIVANIPIYYIFTDCCKNTLWGDISCLGLVPHIGLFNFFLGIENEDYYEYIRFCREAAQKSGEIKTTKAWEESVYRNRLDVFNHMQYEWEHGGGFFVKNAVNADYNEKGYFNIKSGKHRVIFMLVKGKRYIPLKLKRTDYEKWNNLHTAKKLKSLLNKINRESLPAIPGNPYFYDYPCCTSSFYEQVLIRLISAIYQIRYYEQKNFDFNKENILLYNTALSLYADVLHIIGFNVDVAEDNIESRLIYETVSGQDVVDRLEKNKEYFLAVFESENKLDDINVNAKSKVYITNSRNVDGRLLASGFGENGFLYAFMRMH